MDDHLLTAEDRRRLVERARERFFDENPLGFPITCRADLQNALLLFPARRTPTADRILAHLKRRARALGLDEAGIRRLEWRWRKRS